MALHRRDLLVVSGAGVLGTLAGCLPGAGSGNGDLTIGTSHPEPQTLAIEVTPAAGADPVFSDTVTVTEDRTPIEHEAVVSGRNGDEFAVAIDQRTSGERFETVWELDCEAVDRPDALDVTVTEWGAVHVTQNRCGSGFEDSPSEPPSEG